MKGARTLVSIKSVWTQNGGLTRDWGLIGDQGLNEGLKRVSCAYLQVLRCHPCACKLFGINFPLNS